jgi:alanine racemase
MSDEAIATGLTLEPAEAVSAPAAPVLPSLPLPAIAAHAPAALVVDLDALRANYRALRTVAGSAYCAAVVKADAYGLGLEAVVQALLADGCRVFFVASMDEAWRVRGATKDADIYVLGGLLPGMAAGCVELAVRPVLGSLYEIAEWGEHCAAIAQRLPAALHIDTGLNRLGLSPAELLQLRERPQMLEPFALALVMSHLACGEEPGHPRNTAQRQAFDAARALLPPAPASLGASAGLLLGPLYHYDLVRPGIALYGGAALTDMPNPMKPVVRLLARILQVREIAPGETVGYGAAFVAGRPTRIATLGLGYADGLPRSLVTEAARQTPPFAIIGGHRAPLVGRLSMDLVTLDVTDLPREAVERGAFAELIGPHYGVDDIARMASTNGYEILTRTSRRAHRIYLGS